MATAEDGNVSVGCQNKSVVSCFLVSHNERFRLFIDESGDHSSSHQTLVDKRYLGVVGVAFKNSDLVAFRAGFEAFKEVSCEGYDADCPPVFHREDILGKKNGFEWLRNEEVIRRFHSELIEQIQWPKYTVFAVVVDKHTHRQKDYRRLRHPYHYCLHVLLEKYVRFLGSVGATGDVMAESRGRVEDDGLKAEYAHTYSRGTRFHEASKFKACLTSREIKIKKKEANVAGLQLADLVAFGATRDVLTRTKRLKDAKFKHLDSSIINILQEKYYRSGQQINGCGRVILA